MGKQIINASEIDPNKILPMKYMWAREYFVKGVANNWTPEEIAMQQDIELWKKTVKEGGLSDDERRMLTWNLGFFSTAESLTANNIILAVYRCVTNPEARQYLLRQAFEEAIHTDMFVYCCDSLGLNPDDIYNMYINIPSIKKKDDFVIDITKSILDRNFTTEGKDNIQKFLYNIIGYYMIMEGIFFYAGFAMMLYMKRSNRMIGVGEQFQYVLRDETIHFSFGAELIKTVVAENPEVWTESFRASVVDTVKKGVELEIEYAKDCLPRGVPGMNADMIAQYVQYIADRRLEQINLKRIYNAKDPFPWMSEMVDLPKEKNFFETRVTEYKTGGQLKWD
jgi:ribonucleoside-diphosphate reductase beta chain